jgi:hypothetical protein
MSLREYWVRFCSDSMLGVHPLYFLLPGNQFGGKTMRLRTLALCALVFVLALPAFASGMKAGKWQITVTMDMPGMPMKMPPITMTKCITEAEAQKPEPPKTKKDDDCAISDYNLTGNTATWKVECKKQNMTGSGKMTFSTDSYEGENQFKMNDMEMIQKFNGKYLGACDAK